MPETRKSSVALDLNTPNREAGCSEDERQSCVRVVRDGVEFFGRDESVGTGFGYRAIVAYPDNLTLITYRDLTYRRPLPDGKFGDEIVGNDVIVGRFSLLPTDPIAI